MKKKTTYISETNLLRVFYKLKSDNNCSLETIQEVLELGRTTVHKAIVELKRRGWIRPKAERINNVVQYQIIKKD
jgi:DNA-binding IclR family transcriptional regulator